MNGPRIFWGATCLLFVSMEVGLADGIQSSNRFEVAISSDGKMDTLGEQQTFKATAKFTYSILRKDKEIVVVMHEHEVSTSGTGPGVESMVMKMNREEVAIDIAGKSPVHFAYDQAPPPQQRMMRDTFEMPLYSMTLDEQGNELTRKEMAGAGATLVMKNGAVLNTRLFHPPYYRDKTNWSALMVIVGGPGVTPKGQVSYRKSLMPTNDVTIVSFSGLLTLEEDKSGRVATMTNATWRVLGEETYNTRIDQWETGKMTVQISNDFIHSGKIVGHSRGNMNIRFRRIGSR